MSCGASVAAGVSCAISITFTPTNTGAREATLQVNDDDGGAHRRWLYRARERRRTSAAQKTKNSMLT